MAVIITSIDEYQKLAARTIPEELSDPATQFHALHGMASEIGEIHGLYQKTYQGHTLDATHLKKELGDLMWFVAEFATSMGVKLSDICEMNIEKLMNRYPNGFDVDHSLHRAEGDV